MSGEIEIQPGRQLRSADELLDLDKLNEFGRPLARVAQGAITARELADGSISADKLAVNLAAQLGVAENSITTNAIVSGAVTEDKLADEAVGSGKLKASVISGLTEVTEFAEGDMLVLHSLAQAKPVRATMANALARGYALLQDVRTNDTDGGTFTAGSWVTRALGSAPVVNYKSCVSNLAANVFTLPAGKYLIQGRAPAFSVNFHRCRLWNVTDATEVAQGTTEHSGNGQTSSEVTALVSLDGAKAFRLEHRCGTNQATNGLGNAANFGSPEVYAQVQIWRVW